MKRNIKIYIAIAVIVILLILGGGTLLFLKTKDKSKEALTSYVELINSKDYEGMYSMLSDESKEKYSKEDFIARNKKIYEGIDVENIKIDINKVSKSGEVRKISYSSSMDTLAGELSFDNIVDMKKQGDKFYVVWTSGAIFPSLEEKDKVRVNTKKSNRGDILDRNGKKLATDDKAANVGVVPGKLGDKRDEKINKISEILEVSVDDINTKLNASYVKSDMFVPIKVISKDDERIPRLLEVSGVMINDKDARVYPLGKEAAHLTGYVQNVSAEDLEKNKGKEYTQNSVIGKAGLESIYEEKLRGIDGCEITIIDENQAKKEVIKSKDVKNGSDIKLTIDSTTQDLLYTQLEKDKGSAVAMNPNTGEVLALVSAPGYDPNDFVMGLSQAKWDNLNNDEKKPLYNRFQGVAVPGSVFKPLTAAVGIDNKSINPDETKTITGLKWKKDNSWGDYSVTRIKDYGDSTNLLKAMVYSDNIYFAQATLNMGGDKFKEGLNKFGFGESLPFQYGVSKSQFATNGEFKTEAQLADSGYGQGEVLVNPVHLATMYTMFVNEGNIITPYLEYKESPEKKVWKEKAITKDAAEIVLKDMIQVVQDPNGTGHAASINGVTIAGKTGSAEKKDNNGVDIGVLGWFIGMTTDRSNNVLVLTMAEDTKDIGQSHYVIPMAKKVLEKAK